LEGGDRECQRGGLRASEAERQAVAHALVVLASQELEGDQHEGVLADRVLEGLRNLRAVGSLSGR